MLLVSGTRLQPNQVFYNQGTTFTSCCMETEEPDLAKGFSVMTPEKSDVGAAWGVNGDI